MPEAIVVRDYTSADYLAVTALWREVFGGLKAEDEPDALSRTMALNRELFLLAEEGGELAGSVLGTTDGRRGFLYHVAVLPAKRRRGVGRALLREVERRLFASGVHTIHLRVNGDNGEAIEFYRRLGYTTDPPILGMRLVRPAGA